MTLIQKVPDSVQKRRGTGKSLLTVSTLGLSRTPNIMSLLCASHSLPHPLKLMVSSQSKLRLVKGIRNCNSNGLYFMDICLTLT